jgi:Flp pilus assembly pilin Flp
LLDPKRTPLHRVPRHNKEVKIQMLDFFVKLQSALIAARDHEEGQAMVEYSLILALVSVVALVILGTVGDNVITTLTSVAGSL